MPPLSVVILLIAFQDQHGDRDETSSEWSRREDRLIDYEKKLFGFLRFVCKLTTAWPSVGGRSKGNIDSFLLMPLMPTLFLNN